VRKKGNIWLRYSFSPLEDLKLIDSWSDNSTADLSKAMNKPPRAIAQRVRQLRKEGHYLPHKTRKWTLEEDKIAIELFPDVEKISKMTNRTPMAIMGRLKLLRKKGVKIPGWVDFDPPERHCKAWEPEEDKYLIENIERLGFIATANKLKRSPRSIAYRVLHLSKDNGFSPETISRANELIENYFNPKNKKGDDGE
jgi:hypothetical protein